MTLLASALTTAQPSDALLPDALLPGALPVATRATGAARADAAPPSRPDLAITFRAMASDVTVRVVGPTQLAELAAERARAVFARVEASCTRFDPSSPLMQANAAGSQWYPVPAECYSAVAEAAQAHVRTGGLFDPRVLRTLTGLGYDRSLPFETAAVDRPVTGTQEPAAADRPWAPGLDPEQGQVRIGPHPVDLGGIGKGLAVRWAARHLRGCGTAFLIEAGGDCYLGGAGPHGEGWRIGVENPLGGDDPVAVLQVSDAAVGTSSVRVRRWRAGGRPVHHLIDPRTGRSASGGLLAVTVIAADPAEAEVWTKALFLTGRDRIAQLAQDEQLAAIWVAADGTVELSDALRPHLIWEASDAR